MKRRAPGSERERALESEVERLSMWLRLIKDGDARDLAQARRWAFEAIDLEKHPPAASERGQWHGPGSDLSPGF